MVTHVLMSESFIFAAVPVGHNVPITYNKTNFFSDLNFLSLYEWKSVIPFIFRALPWAVLSISGGGQHS